MKEPYGMYLYIRLQHTTRHCNTKSPMIYIYTYDSFIWKSPMVCIYTYDCNTPQDTATQRALWYISTLMTLLYERALWYVSIHKTATHHKTLQHKEPYGMYIYSDSFTCWTRRIRCIFVRYIRESHRFVSWRIPMWDMTQSPVKNYWFTLYLCNVLVWVTHYYVSWLIPMCGMIYSLVWHDFSTSYSRVVCV